MSPAVSSLVEIAGFPAELCDVVIEPADPRSPRRTVPLYKVADLERWVDRERLLNERDVPDPPYWALIWIGARAIAARMLCTPPPPQSRVLDLGCGLGLSGVAAGRGGAHVCFADKIDAAVRFAQVNAELNALDSFETRTIDFTRDRLDERFDLILAADIVYNPGDYDPLVDFLDQHVNESGSLLVTESLRADARLCIRSLIARGYDDRTEAHWIIEDGKPERTWLHVLTKKSAARR